MDDFPGLLARDFGFRQQGKAAPMAASKSSATAANLGFGIGSGSDPASFSSANRSKSTSNSAWNSNLGGAGGSSFLDDDGLLRSSSATHKNHDFDVFGGPAKYSSQSTKNMDYDSIFEGAKNSAGAKSSASALPVYDKPVYDDDIFDGVPGMKSTAFDVFTSISSPPKPKRNDHYDDFLNLGNNDRPQSKNSSGGRSPKQQQGDQYDDLLGNLGRSDPPQAKGSSRNRSEQANKGVSDFDDLLPGFGSGSSPQKSRGTPDTSRPHQSTGVSNKSTSTMEDPFVIIEPGSVPSYDSSDILGDPLEQISKLNKPDKANFNVSSGAGVFEDDSFNDLTNSVPSFSSTAKNRAEDKQPLRTGSNATPVHSATGEEPSEESFFETAKSAPPKVEVSPKSEVNMDSTDDIWITVSEVPLFTQPTNAPPPSRPPPPRPVNISKTDGSSFSARSTKEKVNEFSSFQHFSPNYENHTGGPSSARNMGTTSIDEFEDFAKGGSRDHSDSRADVLSSEEEVDTNSAAASAAAMKEAMDRAEAKFKHAREVRERENAKTGRNREVAPEKDEKALRDAQDRELREKQERLDREREQREREEKERERRRIEKERERARQVMERAQREAREKAAAEARQKVQKETRERAERAAVQRAQAEARERAAAEARERAERAASEAKERSNAEAREKAAAAARAETEARLRAERASAERAAAEARERAAAKENQQKNENDLESFFGMGARPSSAPRPTRTTTSESPFDTQSQRRPPPEGARRTPSGTSSTIPKSVSTTNMVDDLTSIFGGAPSAGEFQEIEGESEERRRARLERHQRTQERAAKALAEKNERDRQTQREQAERHRLGETLDIEIKRWSSGKEGNLRALLSTMQYILWPECGWQPVSLTDLITAAAVKKAYRKATLCIHPDKVQQKGATLQQKYISEKVFDLLKEAWTKFNSEELF